MMIMSETREMRIASANDDVIEIVESGGMTESEEKFSRLTRNVLELAKEHELEIRVSMDGKELATAGLKGRTVDVDIRDPVTVLKTPLLVKIVLGMRSLSKEAKGLELKVRKDFFRKIFGK